MFYIMFFYIKNKTVGLSKRRENKSYKCKLLMLEKSSIYLSNKPFLKYLFYFIIAEMCVILCLVRDKIHFQGNIYSPKNYSIL